MKTNLSLAKVWFTLSVAVLGMAYGIAANEWGWFPSSVAEQAWKQGRYLYNPAAGLNNPAAGLTSSRVYDREGARSPKPEKIQPGMTLITSSWKWGNSDNLKPGAKLIDRKGQTVHSWQPDRSKLFSGPINLRNSNPKREDFHGSYLLPNGDLLLNIHYIGVVRLDACGKVLWRQRAGNHHSIARAEDGSFWIPGTSSERRTKTLIHPDGFPGIEKPVWLDQILHISEDGEVLSRINVLDVLYENGLQRHLVKALGPYPDEVHSDDPVHLNDVEPLDSSIEQEYPLFEAGDLLVSLRHPSLVLVFDPESGEVKWHESQPFLHQHDPDFIGNGRIGVFDNNTDLVGRGKMLGGSRIVTLQPHTDSTEILFPTPRSSPFYTPVRGKWQMLGNGNMLLTESNPGRVVEVAPTGRTVWEWVHESYSASKVPFVTKGSRYDLTRNKVASWPCSSIDSTHIIQDRTRLKP